MADVKQYLTFVLDGGIFALETSGVKEVLEYTTVTRIPRMPDFLCGVINLRGNVVPVMDMRLKLDLPPGERTVNTCIVIVEVELEQEPVILGCLVDSVKEVIEIGSGDVESPPKMGTRLRTDFIRGMAKQDAAFIIILDIYSVMTAEELAQIQMTESMGGSRADSHYEDAACAQ